MKALKVKFDNGISRNEGLNAGKYPLHHFYANKITDTVFRHPLNIAFAGYDEWIKGCCRKRTNSELFAVEFVRKGSMVFVQDGKKYTIEKDSVFLVREGADSEMLMGEDAYCFKMTACISGPLLNAALVSLGLNEANCIKLNEPAGLEKIMNAAIKELKSQDKGFQGRASELAYSILLRLGAEYSKRRYPAKLLEAVGLLESNLHKPLTLPEVCRSTGISQPTLSRLFRTHMNLSPIEYFIRQKMLAAKELLKREDMSIKEISQKLGYSNQLYFSSEFKKRMGASPKEFRLKPQ